MNENERTRSPRTGQLPPLSVDDRVLVIRGEYSHKRGTVVAIDERDHYVVLDDIADYKIFGRRSLVKFDDMGEAFGYADKRD